MMNLSDRDFNDSNEAAMSEADLAAEEANAVTLDAEDAVDPAILETVQVTSEKVQGRQRRIAATIGIPQPIERVWQVLTDYEHLADFIPNLTKSRRLPTDDGILIEQMGAQCFLNIKFCARVVLQMKEQFPGAIHFEMVEGDFKGFEGAWRLEPIEASSNQPAGTKLSYELLVLPRRTMPISLIERRLCHDMAVNLAAIYQRVATV
jgi:ribosome-associated toxin RatA of RatAB toxin-antitoxin module